MNRNHLSPVANTILALTLITSGCTQVATSPLADTAGPTVLIQYDGKPLADCHIILFEGAENNYRERWQGWSDQLGTAALLPSGEDTTKPPNDVKYRVALSSLGDGGWLLEPRLANPMTSPIDLVLTAGSSAVIRLPTGTVKPL